MLKLKFQHRLLSVNGEKSYAVIQAQNYPLKSKMETLFPGLENYFVERNHILDIDRNIHTRLLIQVVFINQVSYPLPIDVRSTP